MATLTTDDDGRLVAELDDHKGRTHRYRVELPEAVAAVDTVWACLLRKAGDPVTAPVYTVILDRRGTWSCDCPAFQFRKDMAATCKHVRCARDVRAAQMALAGG
jgi:hypothetical protein